MSDNPVEDNSRGRRRSIVIMYSMSVLVAAGAVTLLLLPRSDTKSGEPQSTSPTAITTYDPQAAPLDLHGVDVHTLTFPAGLCATTSEFTIPDGQRRIDSSFGPIEIRPGQNVVYGDIDGDGQDEAAYPLPCYLAGSDAPVTIDYPLFTGKNGYPEYIEALTGYYKVGTASHLPLITKIVISEGWATVYQSWFKEGDAECCPSGQALQEFSYGEDKLLNLEREMPCPEAGCP